VSSVKSEEKDGCKGEAEGHALHAMLHSHFSIIVPSHHHFISSFSTSRLCWGRHKQKKKASG